VLDLFLQIRRFNGRDIAVDVIAQQCFEVLPVPFKKGGAAIVTAVKPNITKFGRYAFGKLLVKASPNFARQTDQLIDSLMNLGPFKSVDVCSETFKLLSGIQIAPIIWELVGLLTPPFSGALNLEADYCIDIKIALRHRRRSFEFSFARVVK
jgi:hypothetical protein